MTDFFDSAQHYQLCKRSTKIEFTEWARSRLAALLEPGRSESAPRPSRQMTPASQPKADPISQFLSNGQHHRWAELNRCLAEHQSPLFGNLEKPQQDQAWFRDIVFCPDASLFYRLCLRRRSASRSTAIATFVSIGSAECLFLSRTRD